LFSSSILPPFIESTKTGHQGSEKNEPKKVNRNEPAVEAQVEENRKKPLLAENVIGWMENCKRSQ
jgi:hypothetical protein